MGEVLKGSASCRKVLVEPGKGGPTEVGCSTREKVVETSAFSRRSLEAPSVRGLADIAALFPPLENLADQRRRVRPGVDVGEEQSGVRRQVERRDLVVPSRVRGDERRQEGPRRLSGERSRSSATFLDTDQIRGGTHLVVGHQVIQRVRSKLPVHLTSPNRTADVEPTPNLALSQTVAVLSNVVDERHLAVVGWRQR